MLSLAACGCKVLVVPMNFKLRLAAVNALAASDAVLAFIGSQQVPDSIGELDHVTRLDLFGCTQLQVSSASAPRSNSCHTAAYVKFLAACICKQASQRIQASQNKLQGVTSRQSLSKP